MTPAPPLRDTYYFQARAMWEERGWRPDPEAIENHAIVLRHKAFLEAVQPMRAAIAKHALHIPSRQPAFDSAGNLVSLVPPEMQRLLDMAAEMERVVARQFGLIPAAPKEPQ